MEQRTDGRKNDELRQIKITRNYIKPAEGSVLIEIGDTKIICTATIEERVPPFLKGANSGWVTAEYAMLPRATQQRTIREAARGRLTGRTMEIQRLIGRSLRSVMDLSLLGERTIWLDCDVIQADGGTRTAAITGAFIALADACGLLLQNNTIKKMPLTDFLGAISVGKLEDKAYLDLCYIEDSQAEVDMNVVMTGKGNFVEIQGTAEGVPFNREEMDEFLDLAGQGIKELIRLQKEVLGDLAERIGE